jgi:hypothetical protein
MALIAPFARVVRSTNRSTPRHGDHRMPATERYRRPADQRVPAPDGISPPGESQTLLTAEPLDLDSSTRSSGGYTRNVTKPPSSGPKCSERSGIETRHHARRGGAGTAPALIAVSVQAGRGRT